MGSFLLTIASAIFVLLATRIQPLKSNSDERLRQRNRVVAKDEQNRTTIEFVWQEVIDSEGEGEIVQRQIITPFLFGIILVIAGFRLIIFALPVFSEVNDSVGHFYVE